MTIWPASISTVSITNGTPNAVALDLIAGIASYAEISPAGPGSRSSPGKLPEPGGVMARSRSMARRGSSPSPDSTSPRHPSGSSRHRQRSTSSGRSTSPSLGSRRAPQGASSLPPDADPAMIEELLKYSRKLLPTGTSMSVSRHRWTAHSRHGICRRLWDGNPFDRDRQSRCVCVYRRSPVHRIADASAEALSKDRGGDR